MKQSHIAMLNDLSKCSMSQSETRDVKLFQWFGSRLLQNPLFAADEKRVEAARAKRLTRLWHKYLPQIRAIRKNAKRGAK